MKNIRKDEKFHFKHRFGQNFLKDDELLENIVKDAGVEKDSQVLEIGAGAGALTQKLCEKASSGHIFSVEIDKTLQPILDKNLKNYSNINLRFADILTLSTEEIKNEFEGKDFKVVANLPYYITTPILEFLLESDLPIIDITVMVQLEVANRLCARVGTKDYGAITPIIQMYGESKITRLVDRTMFTPMPKVDSAIVHIKLDRNAQIDRKYVSSVIKKCFLMRRKTLQNNLVASFNLDKEQALSFIKQLNLEERIRPEQLDLASFLKLAELLKRNWGNSIFIFVYIFLTFWVYILKKEFFMKTRTFILCGECDSVFNTAVLTLSGENAVCGNLHSYSRQNRICKIALQIGGAMFFAENIDLSMDYNFMVEKANVEDCVEICVFDDQNFCLSNNLTDFQIEKLKKSVFKRDEETEHVVETQSNKEKETVKPENEGESTFFDAISMQFDEVFNKNKHCEEIENLIPNSQWVWVNGEDDVESEYVLGKIFDENGELECICYAEKTDERSKIPNTIDLDYAQWLPLDENNTDLSGFYIMYQDAKSGETIKID